MKFIVAAIALIGSSGIFPLRDRQVRVQEEVKELKHSLRTCISHFSGDKIAENSHLQPAGSVSIVMEEGRCSFSVGLPAVTSDELTVLDRALSQTLALDKLAWRPVRPDNIGHGWCDGTNQLHLHSLEEDMNNPGALRPLIKKTQLYVYVEQDRSGWMCNYLSHPAPPFRNPYDRMAARTSSSDSDVLSKPLVTRTYRSDGTVPPLPIPPVPAPRPN